MLTRICWLGYDSSPWIVAEFVHGAITWDTRVILEIRTFPSPQGLRSLYPTESDEGCVWIAVRKVDSQLQSRIRLHVPEDSCLIYNCVPRKLKRHSSQNQNADIRHLLDSLVSALAFYATAFRSKLFFLIELIVNFSHESDFTFLKTPF